MEVVLPRDRALVATMTQLFPSSKARSAACRSLAANEEWETNTSTPRCWR